MRLGLFGRPSRPSTGGRSPSATVMGAPPAKQTAKPDIIQTLDNIRAKIQVIDKREAFQETKIAFQCEEAKQKMQQGDKRAALVCLKRKHQLERDVEKLMLMRSNLEDIIMNIETGTVSLQVQHGLAEGLAAQKRLGVDPDKIAELHAEIEDQLARVDEAVNTLASPLALTEDNDDILRDLQELELEVKQEQRQAKLTSTVVVEDKPAPEATVVSLPIAPMHEVVVQEDDDEAELRRLEMEMSM